MQCRQRFLQNWPWDWIVEANKILCERGKWQHGISREKGPLVQELWESTRSHEMTLLEALTLLRTCHVQGPFLNGNGNVFIGFAEKLVVMLFHDVPRERQRAVVEITAEFVACQCDATEIENRLNRCLIRPTFKSGDRVVTLRRGTLRGKVIRLLREGVVEWQPDGSDSCIRSTEASLLLE